MGTQLPETNMTPTRRLCFALDLKDDPSLIEQYVRWHAPGGPPPHVTQSLRRSGIEELQIFLCGNRLFMVMEVLPQFSPEAKAQADAADPQVQEWETLMWQFQLRLPWAQPAQKWVPAERIFALSEQP
jgi:L-rhamnose mutarotase